MSFLFSWIFFPLFCVLKSTDRSTHVQHHQYRFQPGFIVFQMCWNTILALLYPQSWKFTSMGIPKARAIVSSQALVFVFYFLDILIMQLNLRKFITVLLKGRCYHQRMVQKKLKVNFLKDWKRRKENGGRGRKK